MIERLPENLKRMGLSWNDRSCVTLTDNDIVFRYIVAEYAEKTKKLFDSGLINNLVERGLLQHGKLQETDITRYPLVITHPYIHRVSYPFEWPALGLKEAALAIIEIEETSNRYGYTLYDPHPFNATIKNGKPVYLDYGSFVPIEETPIWNGYDKAFRDTVLFPLMLYDKKMHYVARLILREIVGNSLDRSTRNLAGRMFQRNILDKLVIAVTSRGEITSDRLIHRLAIAGINKMLSYASLKKILESVTYKARPSAKVAGSGGAVQGKDTRYVKALGSRTKFLKRLRQKVESLEVNTGSRHQTDYYKNIIGDKPPWERDKALWTAKERSIQEIIDRLKPETALDIGANIGWYSLMLARGGASVISFDRDEDSINRLYSYVRRENMDVLPLIMDIRQPTPEYELSIGMIPAAAERFKCEFAMALGVIHHMVHNQGMSLEHLVDLLGMFTSKYLLVEFIPTNDEWASLPHFSEKTWNVQIIKEAFSKDFNFIEVWESYPHGRKLVLFSKKN